MPRIGGLDLLKRIRDLGVTAPVLMMSGDTQKEAVALLAGPVGYLHKPFNRKSSRFPVWSMTPRPGHRCAITRRCNDERRDPFAPV